MELKDGMNFHNFMLDIKPETWFKKMEGEANRDWLKRVSYESNLDSFKWRRDNSYWLDCSFVICLSILEFLEYSDMAVEDLEDMCGFEVDLNGKKDWRISEIKKLEQILDKKLL